MKYLFHNDTSSNSIKIYASDTWMCLLHGEGEEEIANHGRSRVKSFSQETEAKGQQSHGVTILSRSYTLKSRVQDAHDSPIHLPLFFFLNVLLQFIIVGASFSARAEYLPSMNEGPQIPASILSTAKLKSAQAQIQNKFKAMPSRFMKGAVQKNPDEKLHDVSEMYEKHFLREMMKAMRSTVHESGFIQQNQAEKIFREQLDDQYVDKWSEKGGIGLSKIIYEQLIDKFGVQLGIKKEILKPQGPLPLDDKSNFTAHPFRHPGRKNSLAYRIDSRLQRQPSILGNHDSNKETALQSVKTPWDGVLIGKKTLADHQSLVQIQHDNGLKSELVFKGELSNISTGAAVQAGETLGVFSADSKSLYWVVDPAESAQAQHVSE